MISMFILFIITVITVDERRLYRLIQTDWIDIDIARKF